MQPSSIALGTSSGNGSAGWGLSTKRLTMAIADSLTITGSGLSRTKSYTDDFQNRLSSAKEVDSITSSHVIWSRDFGHDQYGNALVSNSAGITRGA